MRARASQDWRVTVSSKPGGTRFMGALALGLGVMFSSAAGGTLLTDWRDWPAAALFVVVGGLFAAGGVHFLRRAGKPMFEIDPTGLTYHPLDDISWKTERIPWERVRKVRFAAPPAQASLAGEYVYFDYQEAPGRNWFTRAYDLVAGRRPGDPDRWHMPRSLSCSRRCRRTSCSNCFRTSPNGMGSRWTGDSKPTLGRDASSPNALGEVRNLPAVVAGAALDPVVALAHAGLDLQ